MSIATGYKYRENRYPFKTRTVIIAVLACVVLVGLALLAYYVVPDYVIAHKEAHRFDHVEDEKKAITLVVLSELSHLSYEMPSYIESESIRIEGDYIAVFTENLYYCGSMKGFTPFDIVFRPSAL